MTNKRENQQNQIYFYKIIITLQTMVKKLKEKVPLTNIKSEKVSMTTDASDT